MDVSHLNQIKKLTGIKFSRTQRKVIMKKFLRHNSSETITTSKR